MFKKLLHRITVAWCLYGLVRVCIYANPLVFWVAKMIKPFNYESSIDPSFNDAWDSGDIGQIMEVWFFAAIAIGLVALAGFGIHHFANWFFNTANENEEE